MIEALIKKLVARTQSGEYQWKGVADCISEDCEPINISLRKYIIDTNKAYYNGNIHSKKRFFMDKKYGYEDILLEQLSYSLDIEGGVISILTYAISYNEYYYILVGQNGLNKKVISINFRNEYQKELADLVQVIKNRNDNIDLLIEKILED